MQLILGKHHGSDIIIILMVIHWGRKQFLSGDIKLYPQSQPQKVDNLSNGCVPKLEAESYRVTNKV